MGEGIFYYPEDVMTGFMVRRGTEAKVTEIVPGCTRRTLGISADQTLIVLEGKAGVTLPIHSHPHRQVGTVIRGAMEMTISGEVLRLEAGDGYGVEGDVPHGVRFIEDTLFVEVFTPRREAFHEGFEEK